MDKALWVTRSISNDTDILTDECDFTEWGEKIWLPTLNLDGSFELGDFKGSPSYLTDVPVDLLDAFINYHTKGYGVAVFDEEVLIYILVMTAYNWGIFIIEEKRLP